MSIFSFAPDESETVFVRKAPFRMILDRASKLLDAPEDLHQLYLAEDFDTISFWRLEPDARERLGTAVLRATELLRRQIANGEPVEEPVRPGIDEKLVEIVDLFTRHLNPTHP